MKISTSALPTEEAAGGAYFECAGGDVIIYNDVMKIQLFVRINEIRDEF